MFKIAVICGGPSLERGISLNSARSVLDHLQNESIEIVPIYVNQDRQFFLISQSNLYSNTPYDFDFKLHGMSKQLTQNDLASVLQSVDLTFPVIHGQFGEDGELYEILEKLNVPFIGQSSASCRHMFHKHKAAEFLTKHGFPRLPSLLIKKGEEANIKGFFREHHLTRAIVKPAVGGSSIGVFSVSTPEEAMEKCEIIFNKNIGDEVIVEPFCQGKEFTIVILENLSGTPIALLPTEIETSYENHQILDYRKKYLATNNTAYHTPGRFANSVIAEIRFQAEKIFKLFGMRDFVRIDGWVMPDNTLYFTDFNPLSGLEQNSFLFRQTSILGMTHRQTLQYIAHRACQRNHLQFPLNHHIQEDHKLPVHVLFGSTNAERQVSLMSGTNVWLKLLQSKQYAPTPFLYQNFDEIWKLPYSYALNHTVEEVRENCIHAEKTQLRMQDLAHAVQSGLGIPLSPEKLPKKITLEEFCLQAKADRAFAFIGLHGGDGENGVLQKILEDHGILYNGSDSEGSQLCMDKFLTGQAISSANVPYLTSLPKVVLSLPRIDPSQELWETICDELNTQDIIIKPRADGCSAGIVLLRNYEDLKKYVTFIKEKAKMIPIGTFAQQGGIIEMPSDWNGECLFEAYIETDSISIHKHVLSHRTKLGWLELTVGVLEKEGRYHSLNPSITIAEGAVLSLEEKFQGGTGINLTPPPESIIKASATAKIKEFIEKTAAILKIKNYARIDIFFNHFTEEVVVIEANSLPALTPSTVIYHQGLAESPPMTPRVFLEMLIANAKTRSVCFTKPSLSMFESNSPG